MTLRRLNWQYTFASGYLVDAMAVVHRARGIPPAGLIDIDAFESVAERVLHGGVKVTRC